MDYTDCQLRLGLIRWLICLLPSSGKGLDGQALTKAFETALYRARADGTTQVQAYFAEAVRKGLSPHLGIQKAPKSSRATLRAPTKSAVNDILAWASSIGLLTHPSVRFAYSLTKEGYLYQQLMGSDAATGFAQGKENPFLLPAIERRLLFAQEISKDPVLLPFLIRLADTFPAGTSLMRSGEFGKRLVLLLIESLRDVYAHINFLGLSRDAQALNEHISKLLISIGEMEPTVRQRAARARQSDGDLTDSFKMAKHRLTPRIEHLTDYGFLRPCQVDVESPEHEPKDFCWEISETAQSAARFLKGLPKSSVRQGKSDNSRQTLLPALKPFLFERYMEFVHNAEGLPILKNASPPSHKDLLDELVWAYNRCSAKYGYTGFQGLALVAGLHALESGKRIEVKDFYGFLRNVAPADPQLSKAIRFAGRPEPESMHIRIIETSILHPPNHGN